MNCEVFAESTRAENSALAILGCHPLAITIASAFFAKFPDNLPHLRYLYRYAAGLQFYIIRWGPPHYGGAK